MTEAMFPSDDTLRREAMDVVAGELAALSVTRHTVVDEARLEMCRQEWHACMTLTGMPPSMFEWETHGCWDDVDHALRTALVSAQTAPGEGPAREVWLLDSERALFLALQEVFVWRRRESAAKGDFYDRLSARVAHMAIHGQPLVC